LISISIGLLLIGLLVLLIARAVSATRMTTPPLRVVPSRSDGWVDYAPGNKTAEEVQAVSDAMPSEWCVYEGMTPPLRLKIRGQSRENYVRITRQHIGGHGPDSYALLTEAQRNDLNLRITADAYVTDWEGATYPNGNPLPFSLDNLMALIEKDTLLLAFIRDNAHRLSPPWPSPEVPG
jgi:hypothetical protein